MCTKQLADWQATQFPSSLRSRQLRPKMWTNDSLNSTVSHFTQPLSLHLFGFGPFPDAGLHICRAARTSALLRLRLLLFRPHTRPDPAPAQVSALLFRSTFPVQQDEVRSQLRSGDPLPREEGAVAQSDPSFPMAKISLCVIIFVFVFFPQKVQ